MQHPSKICQSYRMQKKHLPDLSQKNKLQSIERSTIIARCTQILFELPLKKKQKKHNSHNLHYNINLH